MVLDCPWLRSLGRNWWGCHGSLQNLCTSNRSKSCILYRLARKTTLLAGEQLVKS